MQQFGNPFYNYNPYQAQYNPMNPYQERLAQLQAQSAQPQVYAQQPTGLSGEIVDSIDVVRAKNVDMSGRPTFYPIHTMPIYSVRYEKHKVAEDIALRGMNIPSYPGLTKENIEFICDKIREFYNNKK